MRSIVGFALVVAGIVSVATAQSSSDSGWFPSTAQPVPAERNVPSTPVPRERFNQPGFVRPTQHASPLDPVSATPTVPSSASESATPREFTAEEYQRNFQPSYIPAMPVETTSPSGPEPGMVPEPVRGSEPDWVPTSWLDDTRSTVVPPIDVDRRTEANSQESSIYEPIVTVVEQEPAAPVADVVRAPPVVPSPIPEPRGRHLGGSGDVVEPRSTMPALPAPQETRLPAVETSKPPRALSFTTLLLFGSLGLNIYLIWISMDTYYRYQDLVNDVRTTRVRRSRRGSGRNTEDVFEPATY